MSETQLTVGAHIGWWIAIGLILAFIPYFPYTKHFHLVMSGFNFLTKPKRTAMGTLAAIDFEDESIEEFGVSKLDATALDPPGRCLLLHHVQPLPGCLPGLHHGQGTVPLGAGGQQALLHQREPERTGQRR